MSRLPAVSVIVALTELSPRVAESLAGFAREAHSVDGELLVVDGSLGGIETVILPSDSRVLAAEPGSLVPSLWRDGLLAVQAPIVAISSATMIPRSGWLRALLHNLEGSERAGVGGSIEPGQGLSALDSAVYLARYLNYFRPSADASPAGENVLYRRHRLMAVAETWKSGFWEAEVHEHLRMLGDDFGLEPSAVLEYSGGAQFASTLNRRFRHALRYGATRPQGKWGRWQALASPALPALLAWRIAQKFGRVGIPPGLRMGAAFPWLALVIAWSLGEGCGSGLGPLRESNVTTCKPTSLSA